MTDTTTDRTTEMAARMNRFTGRRALVTGAARGIGRQVAARLAAEGATVTLCDVREDVLGQTVSELSVDGTVDALAADITDLDRLAEWLGRLDEPLDILVNNAALAPRIPLDELTPTDLGRVMETNFAAATFLSREVGRRMSANGRGSIVNVASVNAMRGQPEMLHYNASKAALISMTQTLAVEFAPAGVRVNAVAPGSTATEIWQEGSWDEDKRRSLTERIPLGRFAAPEEIAAVVAFLAADDSSYVTGHVLVADGGLTVRL